MTIQVGHPHECPTFFCAPKGKSTSQQVNKFASWRVNRLVSDRSDKSDSSDATKRKSPLSPFFAKYMRHLRHISITISIRYNLTNRKNRPFGLFLWVVVWVIIKSGVGVAYFKKLSYFCDSFLDDSMLFGLLLKC